MTALDFLDSASLNSLAYLRLGRTHRGVDLTPIENSRHLKALSIDGKYKQLASIGKLNKLRGLCIWRAPKKVKLGFINELRALQDLTLMLGGRDDISEVRHAGLRTLETIRVRGLARLDTAAFPNVRNLIVHDEPRLEALDLGNARQLSCARICNCKSLTALTGVPDHPALTELRIMGTAIDLEALIDAGLPPSLETPAFYQKESITRAIRARLEELGYSVE